MPGYRKRAAEAGLTPSELAARHGRLSMGRFTADELSSHQKKAGNALLLQHGVGYYSALGKLSAAARAKRP
jgi:hypothetical protein